MWTFQENAHWHVGGTSIYTNLGAWISKQMENMLRNSMTNEKLSHGKKLYLDFSFTRTGFCDLFYPWKQGTNIADIMYQHYQCAGYCDLLYMWGHNIVWTNKVSCLRDLFQVQLIRWNYMKWLGQYQRQVLPLHNLSISLWARTYTIHSILIPCLWMPWLLRSPGAPLLILWFIVYVGS